MIAQVYDGFYILLVYISGTRVLFSLQRFHNVQIVVRGYLCLNRELLRIDPLCFHEIKSSLERDNIRSYHSLNLAYYGPICCIFGMGYPIFLVQIWLIGLLAI